MISKRKEKKGENIGTEKLVEKRDERNRMVSEKVTDSAETEVLTWPLPPPYHLTLT